MTIPCTAPARSPYETGRSVEGRQHLLRPGGLQLTARGIALAGLRTGARILDLGCGCGETMDWLLAEGYDAVGIDPVPARHLESVSARHFTGRAESLPFADSSMEAVLAECSFSLFDDAGQAAAECARVLVDGGVLIVSDLYARQPENIAVLRSLRSSCVAGILVHEEFEALLARAGFAVSVWEDHTRALRESAARLLFESGSIDGLWRCGGESAQAIQAAMRSVRAGYFLLLAERLARREEKQ